MRRYEKMESRHFIFQSSLHIPAVKSQPATPCMAIKSWQSQLSMIQKYNTHPKLQVGLDEIEKELFMLSKKFSCEK